MDCPNLNSGAVSSGEKDAIVPPSDKICLPVALPGETSDEGNDTTEETLQNLLQEIPSTFVSEKRRFFNWFRLTKNPDKLRMCKIHFKHFGAKFMINVFERCQMYVELVDFLLHITEKDPSIRKAKDLTLKLVKACLKSRHPGLIIKILDPRSGYAFDRTKIWTLFAQLIDLSRKTEIDVVWFFATLHKQDFEEGFRVTTIGTNNLDARVMHAVANDDGYERIPAMVKIYVENDPLEIIRILYEVRHEDEKQFTEDDWLKNLEREASITMSYFELFEQAGATSDKQVEEVCDKISKFVVIPDDLTTAWAMPDGTTSDPEPPVAIPDGLKLTNTFLDQLPEDWLSDSLKSNGDQVLDCAVKCTFLVGHNHQIKAFEEVGDFMSLFRFLDTGIHRTKSPFRHQKLVEAALKASIVSPLETIVSRSAKVIGVDLIKETLFEHGNKCHRVQINLICDFCLKNKFEDELIRWLIDNKLETDLVSLIEDPKFAINLSNIIKVMIEHKCTDEMISQIVNSTKNPLQRKLLARSVTKYRKPELENQPPQANKMSKVTESPSPLLSTDKKPSKPKKNKRPAKNEANVETTTLTEWRLKMNSLVEEGASAYRDKDFNKAIQAFQSAHKIALTNNFDAGILRYCLAMAIFRSKSLENFKTGLELLQNRGGRPFFHIALYKFNDILQKEIQTTKELIEKELSKKFTKPSETFKDILRNVFPECFDNDILRKQLQALANFVEPVAICRHKECLDTSQNDPMAPNAAKPVDPDPELLRRVAELEDELGKEEKNSRLKDDYIAKLVKQLEQLNREENEANNVLETSKRTVSPSRTEVTLQNLQKKLDTANNALAQLRKSQKEKDSKLKKMVVDECLKVIALLNFVNNETFFNKCSVLERKLDEYQSAANRLSAKKGRGSPATYFEVMSGLKFSSGDYDELREHHDQNAQLFKSQLVQEVHEEIFTAAQSNIMRGDNLCLLCHLVVTFDSNDMMDTCGHRFHLDCIKTSSLDENSLKCPLCDAPYIKTQKSHRIR